MTCVFTNGPAANVELRLGRAPVYLRVVRDEHGRWDALNLLDDRPRDGETIFVYRLIPFGGGPTMHVNYGDRRTGWVTFASYEVVDVLGEQFRSQVAWEAWAERQPVPEGIEAHIPEGGDWPLCVSGERGAAPCPS